MISPDTNVLVRVITWDDEDQAREATGVLTSDDLWIAKTVLLELEWVLRHAYGLARETVNDALTRVAGLRTATLENPDAVRDALAWHADGMDFADALHLASAPTDSTFVTFDRSLVATASQRADAPDVRRLG